MIRARFGAGSGDKHARRVAGVNGDEKRLQGSGIDCVRPGTPVFRCARLIKNRTGKIALRKRPETRERSKEFAEVAARSVKLEKSCFYFPERLLQVSFFRILR